MNLPLGPSYWRLFDLPDPVPEYRFDKERRWRVDLCWPKEKLAVEIEGGVWIKGRHNRPMGFLKDAEKYNALAIQGYSLLRFTPSEMRDGYAGRIIKDWFDSRGLKREVKIECPPVSKIGRDGV